MYSALIIDRAVSAARKRGEKLVYLSVDNSIGRSQNLQKRYLQAVESKQIKSGQFPELTDSDRAFIRNEILLCRYDFRYWSDRYGYREIEAGQGGGHGVSAFWPSQERALQQIAAREEICHEEIEKYGFTQGILGVWNKTRQQGATALLRLIAGHRVVTRKHTRAIAGSLDEDRRNILYTRDHIWLDNLPFFLYPAVQFDVKNTHLSFDNDAGTGMKSKVLYQMASQEGGIGLGEQFDIGHFTEVAKWPVSTTRDGGWRLESDYMPTIPKAITTFVGFESTPWGRGLGNFWYVFTEAIRKHLAGYEQWIYVFTPHYINGNLNRLPAPDTWRPDLATMEHAELVERTSAEWTGGHTVRMTRDQMYWWETKYHAAREQNQLAIFFTDYPATPDQGFQHHESSAFPIDTIDWMRSTAGNRGVPYHIEVNSRHMVDNGESHAVIPGTDVVPNLLVVGSAGKAIRMRPEELDSDPRGILWIWELPKRNAQYVMGMDVTFGRTGWNRYGRVKNDLRTDNAAIEVIRIGKGRAKQCQCLGCKSIVARDADAYMPDHLVAEYAAPIDPEDLAYVANIVGRIYAGIAEDQCECIMEVHPGPGKMTMKKMLELGYQNMWMWIYYADMINNVSNHPGWNATPQSNRDLWVCAGRHMNLKRLVVFSPYFADECADALFNSSKQYAENINGHDDRMRAGSLALWAANKWSVSAERTREDVREQEVLDPQRTDMTMEEIEAYYQSRWDALESLQ